MSQTLSITHFKIAYHRRKVGKIHPISYFHRFESYITSYGISDIRMVVFYFNDAKPYYPYGIHPIILHFYNNKAYISFYHYNDVYNMRVELCSEQQALDFHILITFLEHSALLPLIQHPF